MVEAVEIIKDEDLNSQICCVLLLVLLLLHLLPFHCHLREGIGRIGGWVVFIFNGLIWEEGKGKKRLHW